MAYNFLNNNKNTKVEASITLKLELDETKVTDVKSALESIVAKCNQDDIILLGKLANNNLKRPIALAALRREIS